MLKIFPCCVKRLSTTSTILCSHDSLCQRKQASIIPLQNPSHPWTYWCASAKWWPIRPHNVIKVGTTLLSLFLGISTTALRCPMVNPPAAETAINVRFSPAPFPATVSLTHTNALSVLLLSSSSAWSRVHAPFLRFRYLKHYSSLKESAETICCTEQYLECYNI